MARWETISSRVIFEHPRLVLAEDRVLLPGGQEVDYLRFEGAADYATIIPRRDDGRLLLLTEHAYPVNQALLQFPEGVQDGAETPEAAANRELAEEAGLQAGKLTEIGRNLSHHRRSTAVNIIFLAEELKSVATKPELEEAGITSKWVRESEIWQLIASGKIVQKNTLAAWAMYQASKFKQPSTL